jgi:hypothetical protein
MHDAECRRVVGPRAQRRTKAEDADGLEDVTHSVVRRHESHVGGRQTNLIRLLSDTKERATRADRIQENDGFPVLGLITTSIKERLRSGARKRWIDEIGSPPRHSQAVKRRIMWTRIEVKMELGVEMIK